MNLQDCEVDTEFWTAYGNVNSGGGVTLSVHRWRLVSPEHKVGLLMTQDGVLTNHSRVIDHTERLFATEQEAWLDVANQLGVFIEKIQSAIETCNQNSRPVSEAA